MKRNRKAVSILLTLSLLVALLVPMVGPASAKSENAVSKVLSVSDSYVGPLGNITIKEDNDFPNDFTAGEIFRLTLTPGVKWQNTTVVDLNGVALTLNTDYWIRADNVLEISMPAGVSGTVDIFTITPVVDINGKSGEITVTIDPVDSAVTGGTYTVAYASGGATTAVAMSVEKIGKTGTGGTIRIDEVTVGSINPGTQDITLKLPSNFEWNGLTAGNISFAGGLSWAVVTGVTGGTSQSATITFTAPAIAARGNQRGSIYIQTPIKAKSGAAKGDIEVSITSSTDISDADVVVAKYVDWGVDVSVKSVKELLAGKFDDVTTEEITIEENVDGSLIDGRDLNVKLPDWVKITRIRWETPTGGLSPTAAPAIDGTESDFDITINRSSNSAGKLKFKLELSIEGNKSGDIEAIFSGAGIDETRVVIAKAVCPASAKVSGVKEVKLGVQGQDVGDIYITEGMKGAFERYVEGQVAGSATVPGVVKLTLPSGVKFAATPKAEVVEGNLTIKTDECRLESDDTVFSIPIDSESTKVSTIKVTGIKLTVDRTYPEGDIKVKVGGNAVIENYYTAFGWLNGAVVAGASNTSTDAGEFTTATAVKPVLATCVTPAPVEIKGKTVFKIGETKYTVNGVEKTMDVAPYLKNNRTYLPLRFVAYAAGVPESNIMWNEADQSVVLIKGDRVVKLTIGSNVMMINGVAFTMDVAPELVDPGRTMLPVRWVAQALGCEVQWDEATQSVTVQ